MFNALSHCANKFRRTYARLAKATEAARAAHNFAQNQISLSRVSCEPLEDRTLFNSVTLTSGVLNIVGNTTTGCHLTAYLVNSGKSIDASADNGNAITVALSSVKQIKITGGSGSDYIFVDSGITLPVTISGGDGTDQVRGGAGVNTITEGNGNDWINIAGTSGIVTVGNGNSTILGAGTSDTIVAGGGNDSISGSSGNDSITVGNGNDTVNGNAGNDSIAAGNGNDSINGGLGNDKLTVGTGLSTVIPGSGTNYVVIGNTKDTVVPSAGVNTVVNSSGQSVSSSSSSSSGSTTSSSSTSSSSNSSSSTTTTTTTSTATNASWVTHSAAKSTTAGAPQAIMQILDPVPIVGIALDVRAVNTVVGTGSPIDASYQWNFGDPNGEYNTLPGFNATHVYTTPGNYTITLTVENSAHLTSSTAWTVNVGADNRRAIYVDSVHGSDNNNGSSPSQAVQTAAKADSMIANNTEFFFDRGETFNLAKPFLLHNTNLLVGAYGSGAQPIINYTAPATGSDVFTTNNTASIGVTVQDVTITTLLGTQPTLTDLPMAVMAGGTDTAVLRCTFKDVEYDINASGAPNGLTVEDCSSPLSNGLQGYFVWDQGNDTSIIGNSVDGSVNEHVVRTSSAVDILAMKNNFSNDDGKGCIEIHWGAYAWIDGNTVTDGDIRVGPLGLWGEPVTSATNTCVIQNNTVLNTFIAVDPGAHDISIRNNIIHRNSSYMINVNGTDSEGRVSADIRIFNNTGISTGTTGNFLQVQTYTAGITLENNIFSDPNLVVGANNSAPVYVVPNSFSSFTYVNGNVWQLPKTILQTANGGINLIGGQSNAIGSVTPAAWNAMSVVGTDYFASTTLNSSNAPSGSNVAATAASPVAGVFTDFYGKARPLTGSWTAGAVQL
jgi:PKD repeat protein